MGNSIVIFERRRRALPEDTESYQTEDGTIYYWKRTSPHRLYIILDEKEIDATVGELFCVSENRNSLYFAVYEKNTSSYMIYTANYTGSRSISISFVRDKLEGEKFIRDAAGRGFCKQVRDGKDIVYKLWDDPTRDAILIDASKEGLKGMQLLGLHRGMAIFLSRSENVSVPSVRKLGANVFAIEAPSAYEDEKGSLMYARDSSPFIYITLRGSRIYTFDTEKKLFLQKLKIGLYEGIVPSRKTAQIDAVCGINNGQITVKGAVHDQEHLIIAQLPIEYYKANKANGIVNKIIKGIKDVSDIKGMMSGTEDNSEKDKMIEELVDNAEKLQADIEEQKAFTGEGPSCVICLERAPNIIFFDCMHVTVCEECFKAASRNSSLKICPNCRKVIKKSSKVFF